MAALPDKETLGRIPLFEGLSEDEMEQISWQLRCAVYPPNASIITAETRGEVVYVILSGTVKIKVDQPDGSEVIIAMLGMGEIVGELSLIDSAGRSADVVTQEETSLLWLDRACFDDLINSAPALTRNLLRLLSRRVRLATEQIQALCALDVYGQVARQLLVFVDQYGKPVPDGVRIPMRLTQSDIAGLVGASRERVNQVFVNLRNNGLLTCSRDHRITVLKLDRLREIVNQR